MAAAPKYYVVYLPCKPYIVKYASHIYGYPIICNNESSLCNFMNACLVKERFSERCYPKGFINVHFSGRLCLHVSGWVFKNIGFDFPTGKVIEINQFLENIFFEHLYQWCHVRHIPGKTERKVLIEEFAEEHGIELELDISLEALTRRERRMRDAITKRSSVQQNLFSSILSAQQNRH